MINNISFIPAKDIVLEDQISTLILQIRPGQRRSPEIWISRRILLSELMWYNPCRSSTPKIIWRHILPNTLAPISVQATYICAAAMITEAILSFIGAGAPPSIPSWGGIISEGRAVWQLRPYLVFIPAVFLSLSVLAVNLLGDGLRDALDPRMAKKV